METWIDVGAAAGFAGLVAIAVTVAIERWGGVVGGLLGTLPTTIVPAAVGIHAQAADTAAFSDALYATPAGMLVNALFLLMWRVAPPRLPVSGLGRRLTLTLVLTLATWAAGAALAVAGLAALRDAQIGLFPQAVAVLAGTVLFGVLACRRLPPAPKGKRKVGALVLAARGGLAAVAIGVAVLLAKTGVPLLAGMASVFPAIFVTTMVSLWLSQGESVPAGAVGPMMLGSASVSAFAVIAATTIPAFGPAGGCAVAWVAAALGVTAPATLWLRRAREPASPTSE